MVLGFLALAVCSHRGGPDLGVSVGGTDELLPAPPSENPTDEEDRDELVPGGGDQLLRGRVVDRLAVWNVAAVLERERVGGLCHSDSAGGEGGDVCERARAEHPHDRLEGDWDREGCEEDARHRGLAKPAEKRRKE